MEKYYGQWYYEKKYYTCPFCSALSVGNYESFYNAHKNHLNCFKINKKSFLKSIMETNEPPTKKFRVVDEEWEKFNRFNPDYVIEISDDDCMIIKENNQNVEENEDLNNFEIINEFNTEENSMIGGSINNEVEIESDLKGSHRILRMNVSKWNIIEIILPNELKEKLFKIINEMKNVKIQFGIMVEFVKENEIETRRYSNRAVPFSDDFFEEGVRQLNEKISIRTELGSSWTLSRIMEINFKITKISVISRLSGSCYIKTPKSLNMKKAVINVKNNDNKCFLYSILAILKKEQVSSTHRYQVTQYEQYLSELNYDEADFPMKLKDIPKFEQQNPGLSINVLTWDPQYVEDYEDDEEVMKHPNLDIIYRSKVEDGRKIYLILLENQNKFHYIAVFNLDRLMKI